MPLWPMNSALPSMRSGESLYSVVLYPSKEMFSNLNVPSVFAVICVL